MQIENEAVQNEVREAVQMEAGEAVQIEVQALVSDRVNQDPCDTHLPATAWPRQMFASWMSPSTLYPWESVAVITTRPQRAHSG